ncbi:hypothetical protein EVG20_g9757 [Dentipellis fragilis]|uniref:DUF6533 domain-containing protein n=1 Tax=Dentipellis fragilis TaxID=205917 RepID=A0A4Y9XW05_9AGAM|nr:hypothetical protein EVG20_g9757 [Dentipellis fragilis]
MDAGMVEQLIAVLKQMKVVTYFDLSALTLLSYDYLLTLPDELELIWGSSWTVMKVVFLLNRYVPFVDTGIGIYHQLGTNISDATCSAIYSTCGWMIAYGVGISELILIFRTWAIWGKDKRIGYSMGVLFIVAWTIMSVYLNKFLNSMEFIPIQSISPNLQGCFVTKVNGTLYICYVMSLSYETLRVTNSPLIYSLYRDGILAYFFMLISSIANVVVLLTGPLGYTNLLSAAQRVFHVVLTTRIVLNIRRTARATQIIASNPEALQLDEILSDSSHIAMRVLFCIAITFAFATVCRVHIKKLSRSGRALRTMDADADMDAGTFGDERTDFAVLRLPSYSSRRARVDLGIALNDHQGHVPAESGYPGMIAYGVGISEIILIFRTWAIWGKDKRVGYGLGVLFLKSMEFSPLYKIFPTLHECFMTNVDNILYICYVISLAYEATNYCLPYLGQRITTLPDDELASNLFSLSGRRSVIFFLLITSIANVLVLVIGPPGYTNLLSGTQRVLHIVLTTRIVLNIRRSARATRFVLSSPDEMELEQSHVGSGHLAVRLRM